jgi:hypothetical protein
MEFSKLISIPAQNSAISRKARPNWQEIVIALVLASLAGFAAYQGSQLINPAFTFDKQTTDAWFHTDTTRVFDDMAVYAADHYRTNVHPLFVLLALPPVYALHIAFGLDSVRAVHVVIALVAALWIGVLFSVLRLIGIRRLDAVLFSILCATSASAIFWSTIPETYIFGSLTLLLALGIAAIAQDYHLSAIWYVAVSVLTLGITVTNWMAGILATIVNHRPGRSLLITSIALAIVSGLVLLQKLIFPAFNSGFLRLWSNAGNEATSTGILVSQAGGPLHVIKCIIFDTIVMPGFTLVENSEKFPNWSRMTIQLSPPGSGSFWGYLAVVLWIALLSLGVWGLFSIKSRLKFRLVLGLTLLGQIVLHLLYGDETFLHSPHFLPLLVILAALSTLTRARALALVLTAMLVLSAGVNNWGQFRQATAFTWGNSPLCAMSSVKCGVNQQ